MTREPNKLTAYSLKLSVKDKQVMKLICALDSELKYQYSFFDEAVKWADKNKSDLMAIANPKDGTNQTYYLSSSVGFLEGLEHEWNCNTTRALYTSVIQFLRFREKKLKDQNLNNLSLVTSY